MPQIKEDRLIAEAMDRREFLRMMGRGAAAAAAPKGVIAKALTSVPANAKADMGKAIIDYLGMYSTRPAINPEDILGSYKHVYSIAAALFSAIKQHNISFKVDKRGGSDLDSLTWELNTLSQPIAYLTGKMSKAEIPKFLSELGVVDFEDKDDIQDAFINDLEQLPDSFDHRFIDQTLQYSFKNNLITPDAQKILEDTYRRYKCDYVNDPASKARKDEYEAKIQKQIKDSQDAMNYRAISKDINYSRMDRAGGSEDVGYAQHYEKKQTKEDRLIAEAYIKCIK